MVLFAPRQLSEFFRSLFSPCCLSRRQSLFFTNLKSGALTFRAHQQSFSAICEISDLRASAPPCLLDHLFFLISVVHFRHSQPISLFERIGAPAAIAGAFL
jgi:hypothetical protein